VVSNRLGRRVLRRLVPVAAAALVAGAGLSACGGASSIRASADFSDVSDLAVGAPVELADIRVGNVTSITLDADQAKVEMSIQRSADVPADVTASVETTTILGERIIELAAPTSGSSGARLLADGARIRHTVVVPDLEQLVRGGAQLFSPISTSALAALVQAGGEGFGSQGADIHRLIDDLDAVSAGYAGQTSTIQNLVNSLDQLGESTAPDAQADAQAVSNLARTTQVLAGQSQRFEDLLSALDGLSTQGRSILEQYLDQIHTNLSGLAAATSAVAQAQAQLAQVLIYLKGHNATISQATVGRLVQILDDIIVCGVPGGGADPSSPVSTCTPSSGAPSSSAGGAQGGATP
jgi:phospholipid/cholesterol/gamma-HCH transport system substrate-binding protein